MWHQILIFVPVLGALLDVVKVLSTPVGRVLILAALVVGLAAAMRRSGFVPSPQKMVRSAVLSLVGAVLTFVLSIELGLGAVVASAVVGLVGAQVVKGRDQLVLYLGAFVGMSSALRFPTYTPLLSAGLLGGLFYELLEEVWEGCGGRLGTIAAAAVLVVLAVTGGV